MGINTVILNTNYSNLRSVRVKITDESSVKPYANMEFRLHTPPTMALKEIVDATYPTRLLVKDRQFVQNSIGEKF